MAFFDSFDLFDQIDQNSGMELKNKIHKLKLKNIQSFLESSLKKTYNLYKKNKNSNISFAEYQEQLLQKLEKQKKIKIPQNIESLNMDNKQLLLFLLLLKN